MVATKPEKYTDNLLEIKLLAIFQGLQLCLPMGISNLIVESDFLLAIQALKA